MPTFFGRRYRRRPETVGNTEKVLGALILLLVAAVVATYVVQTATNKDYLFEVDEAAYRVVEQPHQIAVAQRMLPALENPSWRAAEEVQVISADGLTEALGAEAEVLVEFGVREVYRRRYETIGQPQGVLTATVCDMATPAQAFGLCRALRPADAEELTVGQQGWSAEGGLRAGFWNGRYFTELRTTSDPAGTTMTIADAARAIAAVQLPYGRPFAAERMLPSEGRIPGSLRYVHGGAFGVDSLNEAFLVDLDGGVTAWVMDAETVSAARQVVDDIKGQLRSPDGPDTAYGAPGEEYDDLAAVRQEGPLTVASWSGGEMAIFPAGRHVYGVYGQHRQIVTSVALSAHANAVSGASGSSAPTIAVDASEPEMPFPAAHVEGWQRPKRVSHYTADTLYEKIDGRADAYLQFHVVGLTFGTYHHRSETNRMIDVYWYDMGKSENAMGIYRAEESPEGAPISVGRDGYQVGGAVFFWKGPNYVQVLPVASDVDDAGVALEIAKRLAGGIEDAGQQLWALTALPQSRRAPDSFNYIAKDAFGLDFLKDVYTADYDVDGKVITLFIHRADDAASAKALFDKYVGFFDEYGRVIWREPDGSRPIVAGDVAGVIDVVFVKGCYLGGAAGASDAEAARKAGQAFYEELTPP